MKCQILRISIKSSNFSLWIILIFFKAAMPLYGEPLLLLLMNLYSINLIIAHPCSVNKTALCYFIKGMFLQYFLPFDKDFLAILQVMCDVYTIHSLEIDSWLLKEFHKLQA